MNSITACRCRRPVPGSTTRKVVEGFRVPKDHPLIENERGWIELLRLLAGDADPPPSRPAVQALRLVLEGHQLARGFQAAHIRKGYANDYGHLWTPLG